MQSSQKLIDFCCQKNEIETMDEHSFPILKVLFINGTTTSLSDVVKLFKNAKMVLTTLQYGIESDRLI